MRSPLLKSVAEKGKTVRWPFACIAILGLLSINAIGGLWHAQRSTLAVERGSQTVTSSLAEKKPEKTTTAESSSCWRNAGIECDGIFRKCADPSAKCDTTKKQCLCNEGTACAAIDGTCSNKPYVDVVENFTLRNAYWTDQYLGMQTYGPPWSWQRFSPFKPDDWEDLAILGVTGVDLASRLKIRKVPPEGRNETEQLFLLDFGDDHFGHVEKFPLCGALGIFAFACPYYFLRVVSGSQAAKEDWAVSEFVVRIYKTLDPLHNDSVVIQDYSTGKFIWLHRLSPFVDVQSGLPQHSAQWIPEPKFEFELPTMPSDQKWLHILGWGVFTIAYILCWPCVCGWNIVGIWMCCKAYCLKNREEYDYDSD